MAAAKTLRRASNQLCLATHTAPHLFDEYTERDLIALITDNDLD